MISRRAARGQTREINRGQALALSLWIAVNAFSYVLARLWPDWNLFLVILLIVVVSPVFVEVVHVLDKRYKWVGLRSCAEGMLPQRKSTDIRRSIRLQMFAITSGFGATLFILSVQLHLELGPSRTHPPLIQTMAFLFFLASVLNLLQLTLNDFKLSCELEEYKEAKDYIDAKLRFLTALSWHSLVSPVILAFYLLDYRLSLAVNSLYGVLLFYYYFLSRSVLVRTPASSAPQATG